MATGPSSSAAPFLIPTATNVRFTSIVTTGDEMPDWPTEAGDNDGVFGGIPDGLGAFDNGDGTITILVSHEIAAGQGAIRDHGFNGAYIDRIVVDKATLQILASDDLISQAFSWNVATNAYVPLPTAISRLCSADLPEATALYNASSGLGSQSMIYLAGEESGAEGRLFATVVATGEAYELSFLGNMSYENAVANPYAQDKTIVLVSDDSRPGQLYLYVGNKDDEGSEIQKAGLVGGDLYGIKVTGLPDEVAASAASGSFTLQQMGIDGDVSAMTGAALQIESEAEGVTEFLRPEDAAWDPDNPAILYFVTTGNPSAAVPQPSRLYQLTFDDITKPELGGTITMLVEGLGGPGVPKMMDNISVENGKIVIQEDPGNDPRLAKIWEYDIDSGALTELARFDPALFSGAGAITQDEESSGVIDVSDLLGDAGNSAYLVDAQVHAASGNPATVEPGQLLVMYVGNAVQAGSSGNDRLEGNGSAETFNGLNGNDNVIAWGGDDVVSGGNGQDRVLAGTGADIVNGDRGDDWLDGGFGNDSLNGGQGSDFLIGGGDLDTLTGGQGGDSFIFDNRGETGDDVITDFAKGDRLLVTVELDSVNGRVAVGDGLDLFGSSEVEFANGVTALKALGTVVVDGSTYFAYGFASGEPTNGFASTYFGGTDLLIV